jgi:hypothetical protein
VRAGIGNTPETCCYESSPVRDAIIREIEKETES